MHMTRQCCRMERGRILFFFSDSKGDEKWDKDEVMDYEFINNLPCIGFNRKPSEAKTRRKRSNILEPLPQFCHILLLPSFFLKTTPQHATMYHQMHILFGHW